jgi:hypothetical protein
MLSIYFLATSFLASTRIDRLAATVNGWYRLPAKVSSVLRKLNEWMAWSGLSHTQHCNQYDTQAINISTVIHNFFLFNSLFSLSNTRPYNMHGGIVCFTVKIVENTKKIRPYSHKPFNYAIKNLHKCHSIQNVYMKKERNNRNNNVHTYVLTMR